MSVYVNVCHIMIISNNTPRVIPILILGLLLLFHSSAPIRCVVDSMWSALLLQLDGEEAVTALHTTMECVPLCVTTHEEGMEDAWGDKFMI